jgi:dCMP deaminase
MTDWDSRWLDLANLVSNWSKDRSTKVGCVIVGPENQVLSTGYNGFPRGVSDNVDERHERPEKYLWTEHAERNAIYNAARHGVALRDTTIYIPWYPCANCARAIIQAGITTVVATVPDKNYLGWGPEFEVAEIMLEEAGINVRLVKYNLFTLAIRE